MNECGHLIDDQSKSFATRVLRLDGVPQYRLCAWVCMAGANGAQGDVSECVTLGECVRMLRCE
jgi:hypothetical protein